MDVLLDVVSAELDGLLQKELIEAACAVGALGADRASASIDAIDFLRWIVLQPRRRILVMNGVALNLVVDNLTRDGSGRALYLAYELVADSPGAHVAAGRALPGKILTVINIYFEVEAESACSAQKLYGEESASRACADDAHGVARL